VKRLLLGLFSVWQLACAGQSTTPTPPAAATEPAWLAPLDRQHPLVGKIWDRRGERFIDAAALIQRLRGARFVLLGERHDNPDHHRLQARVLALLTDAGEAPGLVLEMLDREQQAAIDAYLATPKPTAIGFGAALNWQDSGWPPFAQYQPIFELALSRRLKIAGGNITHETARALVKQGFSALPAARVQELRLDQPFPEPLAAALAEELRISHCGQLPESLLAPMALAQHTRDAQMARVMMDPGFSGAVVLIAGAGHARQDRGVPYYLRLAEPHADIASIAFREVTRGNRDPRGGDTAAYDYVWFTPRVDDEDPCAAFNKPK
jgi:uncharacterized iron-regulated protein